MRELFHREPARVISAVMALIAVAGAFGVEITTDQQTAIEGALAALMFLGGGEGIRRLVSPAGPTYAPEDDAADPMDFDDDDDTNDLPPNLPEEDLEPVEEYQPKHLAKDETP